jgi:hypothetical protein
MQKEDSLLSFCDHKWLVPQASELLCNGKQYLTMGITSSSAQQKQKATKHSTLCTIMWLTSLVSTKKPLVSVSHKQQNLRGKNRAHNGEAHDFGL